MFVVKSDDCLYEKLLEGKIVGGVRIQGIGKLLMKVMGKNMQVVKLNLEKGFYHPPHQHSENESIGFLISGKLEMSIADRIFIVTPGDIWHHPKEIPHATKAIEKSEAIEIHSPSRKDLNR